MAVEVARHFNTAIRWTFKLEMDMVSIKRLLNFAELPSENKPGSKDEKLDGTIEFKQVTMKYQEHLQPAL